MVCRQLHSKLLCIPYKMGGGKEREDNKRAVDARYGLALSLSSLPSPLSYKVGELLVRGVECQGFVASRAETCLCTVELESGAYRASYVMCVRVKVAGV